jgi:hypothetical protein
VVTNWTDKKTIIGVVAVFTSSRSKRLSTPIVLALDESGLSGYYAVNSSAERKHVVTGN